MHQNYFEGVLQLRNPSPEAIKLVRDMVAQRKGVEITKEIKQGDGIDFYFTSQRYLRTVGKKLTENFCGAYKISSSLHTRDSNKNKDLYRINIYFRCLGMKVGEIVERNGEQYKILKMGHKIHAKNVKTGKIEFITCK